jgi:hypothetical protein
MLKEDEQPEETLKTCTCRDIDYLIMINLLLSLRVDGNPGFPLASR